MITRREIEKRKQEVESSKRCGKVRYRTKLAARKAMKELNLNNKFTETVKRKMTETYYCEPCEAWHLTTKSKQRIRSFKHFKTD